MYLSGIIPNALLRAGLLLFGGALTLLPADAPTPAWQAVKEDKGSQQQSEELLKAAIASAQANQNDTVMLWIQLAAVHRSALRWNDAEQDYQQATEAARLRGRPGENDAVLQNNWGTLAQARGDWKSAELRFRKAYAILDGNHLLGTSIGGSVLSNLGVELKRQERIDEARQAYEESFAYFQRSQTVKTPQFVSLLVNWGVLLFESGSFADAVVKHRQALEIQNALPDVTNHDRAVTLNNLAVALVRLSQFSEAESIYLKIISLLQIQNKQPDLLAAETFNNLAVLEKKTGRYQASEQHENQALQLASACPQKNERLLANIWNNQGVLEMQKNNLRSAKALFQKAANINVRESGHDYASVLSNMADLEGKQHHGKQALKLLRAALEIDEARLGPKHWIVADDLTNLARQLYFEKNLDESIVLYERAALVHENAYGAGNIDLARLRRNLAIVCQAAKRNAEAQKAYGQAIHVLEISSGADSEDHLRCLREYAILLRKMERFTEAEQADVRASAIQVRNAIKMDKADRRLSAGITVQP